MSADFDLDGAGLASGSVVLSEDGTTLEVVEPTDTDDGPGPHFADLPSFVAGFVATTWIRQVGAVHWCASWWRHQEAQVRLEALWRCYEAARHEDTAAAMAGFLRVELDHHMGVLTSREGPFWACDYRQGIHKPQKPWPVEEPPAGLFLPDPRPQD